MSLDEIISMEEAAEISGRAPVSMRAAAARGRLDARRIGKGPRAVWVTTREAVSEYVAMIAAAQWARQPQAQRRPGGHQRRRRAGPPD